jgi:septal ring-binding cell division protein DamX
MRFLKKVFFLSLLGLAGWGVYSAGQNDLFSFLDNDSDEQVQLAKKDRAVKPKSFFSKVKNVMPAPVKQYDYTFFKTLEDVDMERYVDLDGKVKVMKKTVHSWVDEVEKVIHEPRILLASYKDPEERVEKPVSSYEDIIHELDDLMKEKPKKKSAPRTARPSAVKRSSPPRASTDSTKRTAPSAPSLKPYMVQVSSFKKLSHARSMESKLQRKGYSAFVVSVEVSKAKGIWYRVFLGKYQTEANARAIAKEAQSLHNLKTLVLKSSK